MHHRRLSLALLVADLAWSVLAMGASLSLRYGMHWSSPETESVWQLAPFFGAAIAIWTFLSLVLPLDGFRGGWRLSAVVSQLLLAVGILTSLLLSGGYLLRSYVSRLALVQFCLFLLIGFAALRAVVHSFLRAQMNSSAVRRIVILGNGQLARELARKVERHPEMLCRVVGLITPDDGTTAVRSPIAIPGGPRSATTLEIVDLLSAQRTDEVVLVLDECASSDLLHLTTLCRANQISVSLVPQFYELYRSRLHLTDLDGLPLLRLDEPGPSVPALVGKRILDLFLGGLLLLASVPILLPLAAILRYAKGKAFRWETRCGYEGKPFEMLRLNVDRIPGQASRFEDFLRKFSLTELPQLWNVLRGNMSLVGPRPESRRRVYRYSEWQFRRLAIKPGMTGLAQVQGLREQHSSEDKTRFDLQYLLNCSLWTDLSLLLQTIWTLATRSTGSRDSMNQELAVKAADSPTTSLVEQDLF